MSKIMYLGRIRDAIATDFIMPDGHIRYLRTFQVDLHTYTLLTKPSQYLPWPPITALVVIDADFVRHSHNFPGYALQTYFQGVITRAHPLPHRGARRRFEQLERQTRTKIVTHLHEGLVRAYPQLWTQHQEALVRLFTRYQRLRLNQEQLIARLTTQLAALTPAQQRFLARLIADTWQIARRHQRRLDQLLPTVFLFSHTTHITHAMYGLEAFRATRAQHIDESPLDPTRATNLPYQKEIFARILRTKEILEPLHLLPEKAHPYTQTGLTSERNPHGN